MIYRYTGTTLRTLANFKEFQQMTTKSNFEKEFTNMTKQDKPNAPTMMQKMAQSVERIQNGTPTADDYRMIMQWPSIASMFMRSKCHDI